jgi:hypothetical protein
MKKLTAKLELCEQPFLSEGREKEGAHLCVQWLEQPQVILHSKQRAKCWNFHLQLMVQKERLRSFLK